MAQTTTGLRSILSNPRVYDALQALMGASRGRREVVARFIRPSAGSRVLDVGCGTADIVGFLPEAVQYWGFDISEDYIDAARARYGSRATFRQGILAEASLAELPKMDIVLALGVLHHLEDAEVIELFRLARSAMAPGGRLVTIDPTFTAEQNPVARYIVSKDRGRNVRRPDEYRALAAPVFRRIVGTVRNQSWIPYTHWIMECSE